MAAVITYEPVPLPFKGLLSAVWPKLTRVRGYSELQGCGRQNVMRIMNSTRVTLVTTPCEEAGTLPSCRACIRGDLREPRFGPVLHPGPALVQKVVCKEQR